MISRTIFTIISASTLTQGATQVFDTLQFNALQVESVYSAAGNILNVDYTNPEALQSAEQAMYAQAAGLQPLADYGRYAEIPNH